LQGLGTGGWSGVGLGASRAKWLYLPEAHNDYIFAIIGEELGLLGTLVVLALFLALAVGMTRVVKRHPDPFVKIATGGIGAWILGQAAINIGVTINLLPVIGVPLPLISAGGSSLITTLFALAFVIAFARSEPGCAEALASRRFRFRRSLAVLAPGRGRGRYLSSPKDRPRGRRLGRPRQPATRDRDPPGRRPHRARHRRRIGGAPRARRRVRPCHPAQGPVPTPARHGDAALP